MRITWVGQGRDRGGGDDIYDLKTVAAIRAMGHAVRAVAPRPVGRWMELLGVALGTPYYRARFSSGRNRADVRAASMSGDVTVISWEPFDQFALSVDGPMVLVLHNVTSNALPEMYPGNIVIRLLARIASRWERKLYASPRVAAIIVLSANDRRLVLECAPNARCEILPPGMPPVFPLPEDAQTRSELVIFGTYGWRPKHRDLVAFGEDYRSSGLTLPVYTDTPLPEEAGRHLHARMFAETRTESAAMRFGIVTDRFVAGHKLKVTAYIAAGCAVLSYSDIADDFVGIADADLFLRRISGAGEIPAAIRVVADMDAGERNRRFNAFQAACAARFNWQRSSEGLIKLCTDAVRDKR